MYINTLVNKVLDIKRTLVVTDFLKTIIIKLVPNQASRQLTIIYINKKLKTNNLIVKKYKRIFSALVYKNSFCLNSKNILSFFIIFKKRLDNLISSLSRLRNSCLCLKKKNSLLKTNILCLSKVYNHKIS